MAESRRWVSNMKISILLKKGWFSYVRVSLKQEEYHIYMAQLFTVPLKLIFHQVKYKNNYLNFFKNMVYMCTIPSSLKVF